MAILPRHVLCILGRWTDFSIVKTVLHDSYSDFTFDEEFSLLSADDRMPHAFECSAEPGGSTLTDADRESIRSHTSVAYVLSPAINKDFAEDISSRALQLVCTVLEQGGVAAKTESAGRAHGRERWLQLGKQHATSRAMGEMHSARSALYSAWVQRPIIDDADLMQYSVGMHLLGHPDTEVEHALDFESACEWLDLMGLYLVADKPTRPLLDGEGFRLTAGGPRRIISKRPCTRYETDDFFFNPFGYNRLVLRG